MRPEAEAVVSFKSANMARWVEQRAAEMEAGDMPVKLFNALMLKLLDNGYATADEGFVDKLRAEVKRCKTTKPTQRGATMTTPKTTSPASIKAGSKAGAMLTSARVKDASERLSKSKHAVKRPDGSALVYGGRPVETSSEYDLAAVGVFVKSVLRRQGVGVELSEFERGLLAELVEKGQWVGTVGNVYHGGGPDGFVPNTRVKALLDDTLSGGLYITPVEFDSAIITKPLLTGQLSPYVDTRPVTGRRITTGVLENLSLTWGTPDGSPATPFDTNALVSPLDTAVYPVSGFIELGNDFLADTPVNVGSEVVALYGERLKSELDRVIAVGNGTNEPLGLANASGLTAVNSDMGAAGPPTVSDYEAMLFSVPLQYRLLDLNPAYVMNDTTYARASAIKVGPTDQRRVFGQQAPTTTIGGVGNAPGYALFGQPVRISPNLTNNRVIFGGLKKYRLYQRLGGEFIVERGGRTLALSNKTLIGVRARFGGRVVDGAAFSSMSDAQD